MIADYICIAGLVAGLLVIVLEDLRRFRIPDVASLPLILGGLLCAALDDRAPAAAIGAIVGYLFMIAVEFSYRRLRNRDGLGRGDAKLFAAAGAWTGWSGLPHVLLIAAGSALLFILLTGRRNQPIPFGPFLALGLLVVYAS